MRTPLPEDFFNRDTRTVARELLGKYLVHRYQGKEIALMITETEAYVGVHDKASHAYKGRTKRTEVMFGPAGRWYIYLIYGMHWMLNIVTKHEGYPAAVLIRGARGCGGPGKLTKTLYISKKYHEKRASKKTGLWIEDRGTIIPRQCIIRAPRIGVAYAEEWKDKPYRYLISDSCVFSDLS